LAGHGGKRDPRRDTAANRTVSDAILEGPFTVAVDNLRAGENVLAVEVHQTSSGSSDIVFRPHRGRAGSAS
jgi:hypothetical protein